LSDKLIMAIPSEDPTPYGDNVSRGPHVPSQQPLTAAQPYSSLANDSHLALLAKLGTLLISENLFLPFL
jgi:hypothetical protein